MFRSLTTAEQRLLLVGILTSLLIALVTLAAINRLAIFYTSTGLRLLQDKVSDFQTAQNAKEKALRAELDEIERTLYASPTVPTPPLVRRPSSVEPWMLNRFEKLEKDIRDIQRWRYREER